MENEFHGFTLLTHCGGGAFGDVWYCQDMSGKKLALKIISKKHLGDQWKRELKGVRNYRIVTEKNPDLLPIYHVDEDEESFFYTMEPADDVGINDYVADTLALRLQKGIVPPAEILVILEELLREIKAIHEAGFAHRDIKPENILFVNGKPKLADIGLMSSLATSMTQLAGTVDFVPPEQRTGGTNYNKKSRQQGDLYAFGKVMYCMVTGEHPGNYPSYPATLEYALERKYYFRLALRLCDSDLNSRLCDLKKLCGKMEEINRIILFGENRLERIRFALENFCLSVQNTFFSPATPKRKCLFFSALILFISAILGSGYYFLNRFFKPKIENQSDKKIDPDVQKIVEQIQNQRETNQTSPDGIKQYVFGSGKYSFQIPNYWEVLDRKTFMERLKKKYSADPREMFNQLKKMRHIGGIFYLKNEKSENLYSSIVISSLAFSPNQIDHFSDRELQKMFAPDWRSVTIKRHNSFRRIGKMIMLTGQLENGENATMCLLPRKKHCIQALLMQKSGAPLSAFTDFIVFLETFQEHPDAPYPQEPEGRTSLMFSLWYQDFKSAEKLLQSGAKINETVYGGSTALHLAAEEKQLASVKLLLKHKADPNLQDCLKMTPLHIAARDGAADILMELLNHNAKYEIADFRNLTPLCYAVENSHKECVRILLKKGANSNVIVNPLFQTPLLITAVAQKDPEILQLLISGGMDIHYINSLGENALLRVLDMMLRNKQDKQKFAEILINAGININQQNENGFTALMYAVALKNKELASLLIKKGADLTLKDKKGRTIHHFIDIGKFLEKNIN